MPVSLATQRLLCSCFLLISLAAGVVEAVWTDSAILASDTRHGPDLIYQGNVRNDDGTFTHKVGATYTAKSVMSGTDSYFPMTLPESLKTKHLTPDSTHPNLAFWYTPEVFERDNVPDGRRVEEWQNVGNICYHGHTNTDSCTNDKKQQRMVNNNMYVEALKQPMDTQKPLYKKNVVNGHGVVRFDRGNGQGTSGRFLEMYKRCQFTGCNSTFLSSDKGFVTDWTNSQSSASNTAFTIFLVVKTYQRVGDTNPHGILTLGSSSSSGGFGMYKSETKCVPEFSTVLLTSSTSSNLITLSGNTSSAFPGAYDGYQFHAGNETVNPTTGLTWTSTTCTVNSYLPFLTTKNAESTASTTSLVLSGGNGYVGGWLIQQVDGAWPYIRIGDGVDTRLFDAIQISAVSVSGGDTTLTIASTDFSATNVPAGTKVFFSFDSTNFRTLTLRGCEGDSVLTAGITAVIVKPNAPVCQPSRYAQLGMVSAYYGGGVDDNSCATECTGGCNPAMNTFGSDNTCAKKWGSQRKYQTPDDEWKIISVRASGTELKSWTNGLHDGCGTADTCSITAPIEITGATPVSLDSFKVGLLDSASLNGAEAGYATMDLAELMIYDTALTVQEMDRIGNYLSNKYDISFLVNDNIRSPTRSTAKNHFGGCDLSTVTKGHTAPVCEQFAAAANCVATSEKMSLSVTSADKDTDNIYVGMSIVLSKGGDANDGSIKSAAGQSCLVTAYTASTRQATCDLTQSGNYGYVLRSENVDFTKGEDALNPLNTSVMVSWAPSWSAPYYAAIGDTTAARELVKVTAATVVGTEWKLTIERALGGTTAATITEAEAKALAAAAKITYSRSYLAILDNAYQVGESAIIVNDILGWTSLPVAYTNMYVKLTGKSSSEHISVSSATRVTFSLNGTALSSSDTSFNIIGSTAFNTSRLASGDKLRIGDLVLGEIVTLSAACTNYVCTVTRGSDSTTAAAVAAGETLTLIERGTEITNPVVLNLNTGLANSYTSTNAVLADFAWAPQSVMQSGVNFVGRTGVTYYTLEVCDKTKTPFEFDGPIQISQANEYLKAPGAWKNPFTADTRTSGNAFWVGPNAVPNSALAGIQSTEEGNWLELRGWYLFPTDMIVNSTDAYLNWAQITRNLNYLLVTIGSREDNCLDPTQSGPCADGKSKNRETVLNCLIGDVLGGYCANDFTKVCRCTNGDACDEDCGTGTTCVSGPPSGVDHNWYYKTKPMVRCQLPSRVDAQLDLNVYWHGIQTKLNGWYKKKPPVISAVKPSKIHYQGGETLTVMGSNFGPSGPWTRDSGYSEVNMGRIEIRGPSVAVSCLATVYVSSKQLVCKVPALPLTRQANYDKAAKTVEAQVFVHVGRQPSTANPNAMIKYDKVPGYFACETKVATSLDKSTCFQCCRSACIVNEFAEGAKRGGTTYAHCDTQCNKYCGLTKV